MASEMKCPICGARTTLRVRRSDKLKFYVCVNSPRCKGKVAYADEWDFGGDDWDEKPVSRATQQRAPQRTERPRSSPKKKLKYTQSAKFYFLITFLIVTVIGVAICLITFSSDIGYALGYSMPTGLVVALIVWAIAKALGR